MKKRYISPSLSLMQVASELPIADSFKIDGSEDNKITNSSEILGRERGTRNSGDDFDDLW